MTPRRASLVLSVATAVVMTACEDSGGPPELTGEARVRVTTTGLDLDLDGYRLTVDGTDQGALSPNGTRVIRIDPGTQPFALSGIAANCTLDHPGSREVTIVVDEVVQVDFTVVCTARSGVISVLVEASGTSVNGGYEARVDGSEEFRVGLDQPAYRGAVPAGDHEVALDAPLNCLVENSPQTVNVTTGGQVRDTAEARFAVTCGNVGWNLRVVARTTGPVPPSTRYRVMHESFGYWDYGGPVTELGYLEPNGTLIAHTEPNDGSGANYWHRFYLEDVPPGCSVSDPHPYPDPGLTIPAEVEFEVTCSP
jgi:hypothetical protein